jgi:hypothetical protein
MNAHSTIMLFDVMFEGIHDLAVLLRSPSLHCWGTPVTVMLEATLFFALVRVVLFLDTWHLLHNASSTTSATMEHTYIF